MTPGTLSRLRRCLGGQARLPRPDGQGGFAKRSLLAGPLAFALIACLPAPAGMPPAAQLTAAATAWIAIWWLTEAVNPAVTSLLPLVLFPLAGVAPLRSISGEYSNEIVFLFLGGFFFGKTIEHWGLHRRIALRLVLWIGTDPARTVLGFMLATAFISMWISNTATAVMMTPVAVAVSLAADRGENFNKSLLLGVGYACSIGGLATTIGTPTNAIFLSYVQQKMGVTVSFGQWMLFGLPFAVALLLACWGILLWFFPVKKTEHGESEAATQSHRLTHDIIREQLVALGPVTEPERRLMALFGTVILAWISGSLIWYRWVPNCTDTVVAVAGAIGLFLMPAGKANEPTVPLLDWKTAVSIPWGVILFFGGGLALAKCFDLSGLAGWMGQQMQGLGGLPYAMVLLAVLAAVVALSEVASNIATASMMMPVLAALAMNIGADPIGMMMCATMAASFGFGLPIATAPNTIVFSAGYLRTRDMARAGFLLDVVAILLLMGFAYVLL